MTMADECDVSRVVSTFLLNTCRLPPRLSADDIQAAVCCVTIATEFHGEDCELITLVTGSVAEFYIKPMLPHVGDIDVMYYSNTQLAIPRGHPPPTQLPAEFHNYVKVAEIIDSYLPGYVYLPVRYLPTQCIDDGNYNYTEVDEELYFSNCNGATDVKNMHGLISAEEGDCPLMLYSAYVVCCGRHKPLIGQHDTETTAGQTQQLLILLSSTDAMWFVWHIVSVDKMNG